MKPQFHHVSGSGLLVGGGTVRARIGVGVSVGVVALLAALTGCGDDPATTPAPGGTGGGAGTGGGTDTGGSSNAGSPGTGGGDTGGTGGDGTGGDNTGGGGGAVPPGDFATAEVFLTAPDGTALQSSATPAIVATGDSALPTINVALDQTKQPIYGFGVSLTESSAMVLDSVTPEKRQEIIDLYFQPDQGGFTLVRIPMASCDFAYENYSYVQSPPGDLTDFTLQHDIDSGLIQLMLDAQEAAGGPGSIRFIASPWSAPPWMKTNGLYVDGSLQGSMYQLFADYFVEYIDAMAAEGIPIWAVTPENEPEHGGQFDTMIFTASDEARFIAENLGPTLASSHPDVLILGYDHNKGDSHVNYVNGLYANDGAVPYLAGTANHWYGNVVNPFPSSLQHAEEVHPGGIQIPSEQGLSSLNDEIANEAFNNWGWFWEPKSKDWCTGTNYCSNPDTGHPYIEGFYRYARDIIVDLNYWQNGWIQWNALTDKMGGPSHGGDILDGTWREPGTRAMSPVMVDMNGADPTATAFVLPIYYILAHFGRFIDEGALALTTTVAPELEVATGDMDNVASFAVVLAASAANTDGSVAVVVLNTDTNAAADYQIVAGDQAVEINIPAGGLQTVVLRP